MNLIIDIGNTLCKYYLFEHNELLSRHAEESHTFEWLDSLSEKPEAAIISTVVDLTEEAERRLDELGCPLVRFSASTLTPLRNLYHTPSTLGSDRLAAAVGAWTQQPGWPMLIVDAGSCVTFDFVSARGEYLGGNITPGIRARLRAIDDYFPRLPLVEPEGDVPDIGYDTETAIRAGVIRGMLHEFEGYINAFRRKYPSLLVFLTGGDAKHLAITQTSRTFADDFLLPKGLNAILEHSKDTSL
ncbi:MAG: type III pantothenate kinase [Bacteroidaceae bacterium]|nr:type III pantothenate kinase [Bacteroidaceae bacterium]